MTTMSDHITDLIGWGATLILLLTISSQVYEQWRSRSTQGVSHWLFLGQLAASTGFVTYSLLQGDWVFVVSNVFLLGTALLGQILYLRNRRRQRSQEQA
ncbi:PQ-loop repeat-containing protein [Herbaspirillum sp. AP02]|uniref:PQ-loop repeat-containing protein n=1 Tax=unclassified Herbaspirillum TaxID=2624150 RepID=UPI0018CB6B37|nr:PQ-loop repeat-containing protein [Herbaspirillum sp. AP02]